MSNKTFKPLFEFTVNLERELDETNTRIEDGKTITETVKVKRQVHVPFCIKAPSRAEKEEAEIERAAWLNKYVERGLMLEAMLIKRYVDEGGTMPKEYQKQYQELQSELLELERKMMELEVVDKDNPELKSIRSRFFDVREQMIEIQKSQSIYFEDTAEAKSRLKKIEWIALHLSYFRPVKADGELEDWTPFFKGETTEDKLESYDKMVENLDVLLSKAKPALWFMAAALAYDTTASKEEVETAAAEAVALS